MLFWYRECYLSIKSLTTWCDIRPNVRHLGDWNYYGVLDLSLRLRSYSLHYWSQINCATSTHTVSLSFTLHWLFWTFLYTKKRLIQCYRYLILTNAVCPECCGQALAACGYWLLLCSTILVKPACRLAVYISCIHIGVHL